MLCKLLKTAAPLLLTMILAIPASAQIPVPVPDLEIHVAHSHPPRIRHEEIPPRPGEAYTWVAGYWGWQGDDWVWIPGRWEIPAGGGVSWIRPRYVRESGVYRYEPGHWSHQRVVEGDDYRQWKEHRHHRGHDHDRDRDRDER